ncbi:hypothetical protein QQF64_029236 [Cirrhinus molitorella]|uniref:Uncharacterized protein n=1 Tax=Cirrhinus molitorella TaxID=172907 RepID=A0ABR3N8V5_9TELE
MANKSHAVRPVLAEAFSDPFTTDNACSWPGLGGGGRQKALISTRQCNSSSHHPETKAKLFFLLNQDYNQPEASAEDAMGQISGERLLEKKN